MTDARTVPRRPCATELEAFRKAGQPLWQIAAHYGVTRGVVKDWCKKLGVRANLDTLYRAKQARPPVEDADRDDEDEDTIDPQEGMTIVEKAAHRLGRRMSEDRRRGTYLLDGKPVRIEVLLIAAGLAAPTEKVCT